MAESSRQRTPKPVVSLNAAEARTVRRAMTGYLETTFSDRDEQERMDAVLAKIERAIAASEVAAPERGREGK